MSQLIYVQAMLDRADTWASFGRRTIERAVELRSQAFRELPVGAVLQFTKPYEDVYVRLEADGSWASLTDSVTTARREWVLEQWGRANWILLPVDAMRSAWSRLVADCGCPDIFYCPGADEIECSQHSGLDVCCDSPKDHIPARVVCA